MPIWSHRDIWDIKLQIQYLFRNHLGKKGRKEQKKLTNKLICFCITVNLESEAVLENILKSDIKKVIPEHLSIIHPPVTL